MRPEKTIEKLISEKPLVVVALGDSLTYGWMVHKGYLDYMKEMIRNRYSNSEITLINRGIPGDTASGGVNRLQGDVLRHHPDCILIQFGLNDAFVGYSPERYREHIEIMIRHIRENGASEIVLITSVCLDGDRDNAFIDKYYNQVEALSELYQVPVARVHEYWKKKIAGGVAFDSLVQSDGVHPTTIGYKLMAEAIMEVF